MKIYNLFFYIFFFNNFFSKINNFNEIKIEIIENDKNYTIYDYNANKDLENLEFNLKKNKNYFEENIYNSLYKINNKINRGLFFFNKKKFIKFYSKINDYNFEVFKEIEEIRLKYKIIFKIFEYLNFISPLDGFIIPKNKEHNKLLYSNINNSLNELEKKYSYNKFFNYDLIHKINLIYINGSNNNFSKIIYFFKNLFKRDKDGR